MISGFNPFFAKSLAIRPITRFGETPKVGGHSEASMLSNAELTLARSPFHTRNPRDFLNISGILKPIRALGAGNGASKPSFVTTKRKRLGHHGSVKNVMD